MWLQIKDSVLDSEVLKVEREMITKMITNNTSNKVVEQRRERRKGLWEAKEECLSLSRVEGTDGWNGITKEVGLQPDGKSQEKSCGETSLHGKGLVVKAETVSKISIIYFVWHFKTNLNNFRILNRNTVPELKERIRGRLCCTVWPFLTLVPHEQ